MGKKWLTGSDRTEQTDPFCVNSVNQPLVQPISAQSTAALREGLRRDLFLDLCGDALQGALVHVRTHCSTRRWRAGEARPPCDSVMQWAGRRLVCNPQLKLKQVER